MPCLDADDQIGENYWWPGQCCSVWRNKLPLHDIGHVAPTERYLQAWHCEIASRHVGVAATATPQPAQAARSCRKTSEKKADERRTWPVGRVLRNTQVRNQLTGRAEVLSTSRPSCRGEKNCLAVLTLSIWVSYTQIILSLITLRVFNFGIRKFSSDLQNFYRNL